MTRNGKTQSGREAFHLQGLDATLDGDQHSAWFGGGVVEYIQSTSLVNMVHGASSIMEFVHHCSRQGVNKDGQ